MKEVFEVTSKSKDCKVKFSEEDIEDLVVTILEGGIGYWAVLDNRGEEFEKAPADEPVSITATKILLKKGELTFYDVENNDVSVLNLENLQRGIQRYIDEDYDYYDALTSEEPDLGEIDADAADTIAQLAMFGEIVYG